MVILVPFEVPSNGVAKEPVALLLHWFFRADPTAHGTVVVWKKLLLVHVPGIELLKVSERLNCAFTPELMNSPKRKVSEEDVNKLKLVQNRRIRICYGSPAKNT